METRRAGRPTGTGLGRTERLRIQVSSSEKRNLQERAERAGMNLSEYVRRAALGNQHK